MTSSIRLSLFALTALSLVMAPASFAQKSASATSVKIGYFDLAKVKAQTIAGDSEGLKSQAEKQFRQDIEAGQKAVQKARDEKKSEEELKSLLKQVQTELAAKRQALARLVESQIFADTQRLMQTVSEVAKDKSLDLVIDGAGIFAGGQKVLDNGVDVTEEVIAKLNPGSVRKAAPAAAAPAAAPAAKPAATK